MKTETSNFIALSNMKLKTILPLFACLGAVAGHDGNTLHGDKSHRDLQGPSLPPTVDESILVLLAAAGTVASFVGQFETPIAIHFTSLCSGMWWNCVAAYSLDSKDTL